VVDGLDASGRAPAQVSLTATLPGGGALDVRGTARSTPLGSELRARVSRVDLGFWLPYLDLPLQFTGMAETDLTLDVASAAGAAEMAGTTGGSGGVTTRVRGRATLSGATVYGPPSADAPAGAVESAGPPARSRAAPPTAADGSSPRIGSS
jgi:hypothetical protein